MVSYVPSLPRMAVECERWSWRPGMLIAGGPRIDLSTTLNGDELPDLDDPATRGCLLDLVREAADSEVWIEPFQRDWVVIANREIWPRARWYLESLGISDDETVACRVSRGGTQTEALVLALWTLSEPGTDPCELPRRRLAGRPESLEGLNRFLERWSAIRSGQHEGDPSQIPPRPYPSEGVV